MKTSQSLTRDDAFQRTDKYPALGENQFFCVFHLKRESKRPVRTRLLGCCGGWGGDPPGYPIRFILKLFTLDLPKTGEKVQIAPKKLPFFKVGKELKERVDRWSRQSG